MMLRIIHGKLILNPPVNLVEGSRVQPRLEAKN
jgi:hypothetical protein